MIITNDKILGAVGEKTLRHIMPPMRSELGILLVR